MSDAHATSKTKEDIAALIEALLFVSGEAMPVRRIGEILGEPQPAIAQAIAHLKDRLAPSGLRILEHREALSLVTAPQAAPYIETFIKDHVLGELSKAGIETLTIVAYKHPISRPEIDYIRGVNSTFTLRNLIMRGLVERIADPHDARTYRYQPTVDFMKYLGITAYKELPEYDAFRTELEKGLTDQHAES
ncbi:MAG: SMC-Scp complex subunit ScpB [Candidatus Ryanbacteria bacterium RIFCSPHIGHO2_02_FULL_48_12]|jgi:segregation and condensation protein B|uniref:SMC-Scp complex subunit ScpB n=1 Tax=Candidatus Ryanbacteria bacterium RIFCSPHIGHO2_01_FULL_48_27 TaxID=1802115 RepID=A0A1G2G352_9BACT|nr:MAG: SMC-Scp complex subunit ScpB [Candidatus Ryanbacteria bacterium RIFCSPHIGHO2_01_FULL_48_27]OGZ49266.1 MAG: SMC-Scp complex subunit ScpB [Candidatus Ryanbacteria bacterium RIFCSPHIGHO2_02_FULL_48_12]